MNDLEKELELDSKQVKEKLEEKDQVPVTEDHSCAIPAKIEDAETLNEDNLVLVWNKLMDFFKNNEQSTLHSLLGENIPTIDNKSLNLTLDSSVEKEYIEKNVALIKGFLKRHFNDFEDLNLFVTTSKKSKKQILNQMDKYIILAKKNPALDKLRKDLDLELEM